MVSSAVAGLKGSCMSNFWRNYRTAFQGVYTFYIPTNKVLVTQSICILKPDDVPLIFNLAILIYL